MKECRYCDNAATTTRISVASGTLDLCNACAAEWDAPDPDARKWNQSLNCWEDEVDDLTSGEEWAQFHDDHPGSIGR